MAEHEVATTDAEIAAALERARLHDKDPRARAVEHIPGLNLLIVSLSNGRSVRYPRGPTVVGSIRRAVTRASLRAVAATFRNRTSFVSMIR